MIGALNSHTNAHTPNIRAYYAINGESNIHVTGVSLLNC